MGKTYRPPEALVLYQQATGTGCGTGKRRWARSIARATHRVYLDLQFFQELSSRFSAPGDFAQAYVIAHEVGHHVQNLLGTSQQVQQAKPGGSEAEANRYSVALELQPIAMPACGVACLAKCQAAKSRSKW
jgi:predicted metalloprotease